MMTTDITFNFNTGENFCQKTYETCSKAEKQARRLLQKYSGLQADPVRIRLIGPYYPGDVEAISKAAEELNIKKLNFVVNPKDSPRILSVHLENLTIQQNCKNEASFELNDNFELSEFDDTNFKQTIDPTTPLSCITVFTSNENIIKELRERNLKSLATKVHYKEVEKTGISEEKTAEEFVNLGKAENDLALIYAVVESLQNKVQSRANGMLIVPEEEYSELKTKLEEKNLQLKTAREVLEKVKEEREAYKKKVEKLENQLKQVKDLIQ